MDQPIISTLISVALGAITASIPKFWDFLFENKKHKQTNQKLYFERKLDVLQAYVAACTQLSAANFHNAVAVEQMKQFNFFGEQDAMSLLVIDHLNENVRANQAIVNKAADLSSAVSMFIDLGIDEQSAYELIKSIHVDISKLGKIKQEVDEVIEKYNLQSEPSPITPAGKEFFQVQSEYQTHVQKIADSYDKAKLNMNKCIKVVRAEFKKYEA